MSKGSKFRQLMEVTNNFIKFKDANVKSICVQNFDGNGDGEIGKGEAKVVTSIGTYFQGKSITSFDEFKHFTNVKTLGTTQNAVGCFMNCTSLASIELNDNISYIGASVFKGCSALAKIDVKKASSIQGNCFENCYSLSEIRMVNVSNVQSAAFSSCNAITKIIISNISQWLKISVWDNSSASGLQTTASVQAGGKAKLYLDEQQDVPMTDIVVPDSITSIRSQAFLNFKYLSTITLHEGIVSLGYMAFYGCTLSSLTIKHITSLKTVASRCFQTFSGNLDGLPESITSIGAFAFNGAKFAANTELALPLITSLSERAFAFASNVISLDAERLTSIADGDNGKNGVFEGNALTKINLPSIMTIGANAFKGCTKLTDVTLGESLTSVKGGCFYNTSVSKVKLPSTTMVTVTANSYGSVVVFPAGCHIYVPTEELMAEYKADTNWSVTSYNWHLISEWTD